MRVKLYVFLPHPEASELLRAGFPDSPRSYRLQPAEYTACSAFNPKSLVEVVLELDRGELAQHRHELEMPTGDDFGAEDLAADDQFGGGTVEPIYWYDFPAHVLRRTCKSCRLITGRAE